uniref:Uncharacterized protein n=1 Tax=Parascaris univalens TaxID=6257 RepID=A0A915CBT9_PARUN
MFIELLRLISPLLVWSFQVLSRHRKIRFIMPNAKKTNKAVKGSAVAKTVKGYASSVEIDDEISDPEVLAELEYAREHGQALSTADTTDAAKSILPRTTRACERSKSESAAVAVKATQAKAARKARSRGVSGTMSKKNKGVACGHFTSLSEWDDCYSVVFDDDRDFEEDDDEYSVSDEGVFKEVRDGEFGGSRGKCSGLADNQVPSLTTTSDPTMKAAVSPKLQGSETVEHTDGGDRDEQTGGKNAFSGNFAELVDVHASDTP